MNYLITTFDGLGDGLIYYPFFKKICEKYPDLLFFITSNILFTDSNISTLIKLPANLKIIDDNFRKFNKDYWNKIQSFIIKNNIHTIINLRIMGRKFEHDYYEFKEQSYNNHILFYDDETLNESEIINKNIRDILQVIFHKTFGDEISYDAATLEKLSPLGIRPDHITINFHSRGVFKLWEINKWAEVITFLVNKNIKIKIFSGFNERERAYTQKVLDLLSKNVKLNVDIVNQNELNTIFDDIRNTTLLVSVDSWPIHLADAIGVAILGVYITTSPIMWGGVTNKFHYVISKHLFKCTNFYPYFGICLNNKRKCEEIDGIKDDIPVSDVLDKIIKIYEQKN